jgi:hypothetical protein
MMGNDGAVALVIASIAAHYEARLAMLETELGAIPYQVAMVPVFISPAQVGYDSVALDEWPFLLVVPQGDPQLQRSGVDDDGAIKYDVLYNMIVFVWVRGDSFQSTAAVRGRMANVVKECLLAHQKLSDVAGVDETSITVRHSSVAPDPDHAGSTVSCAAINLRVRVKERLQPANPDYGPAQTAKAANQLLP